MINGFVFYLGRSALDGERIVAIATGLRPARAAAAGQRLKVQSNLKTGPVVQTYIINADMPPVEAAATGDDQRICGACSHRPVRNNTCYVRLFHGPSSVYRGWRNGAYPMLTIDQAAHELAGLTVRVGSYGDPGALRDAHRLWPQLLAYAAGHTGYSRYSRVSQTCMMSTSSIDDARASWAKGRRTFRVMQPGEQLDPVHEFMCPASKEAGNRTTCEKCLLCDGLNAAEQAGTRKPRKSVAIYLHN